MSRRRRFFDKDDAALLHASFDRYLAQCEQYLDGKDEERDRWGRCIRTTTAMMLDDASRISANSGLLRSWATSVREGNLAEADRMFWILAIRRGRDRVGVGSRLYFLEQERLLGCIREGSGYSVWGVVEGVGGG